MWLIPTRNRPDAIRELISAMVSTGCVPECAVMVDGSKEPYKDIKWPAHWHIHQSDEHLEVIGAVNALFKLYPDEKNYGFLTDHARPRTAGWADIMEISAGDWNIALCDDTHNRINPRTAYRRMTAASCFGGKLCRELGYVWPDMFIHLYGDDVWEDIGHELKIIKWNKDIIVKDLLFAKDEFDIDDNHKRLFRGEPFAQKDHDAYFNKWIPQKKEVIENLRRKMTGNIVFCCVNKGNYLGRGAQYVNYLFDMVQRNISDKIPYTFECFTDDAAELHESIKVRPLPENLHGWWNKLYLFEKGVFKENERVIYLDLDTVITGGLDDIIKYHGEFAMLRDFYYPDKLASGMMLWQGGFGHDIFADWILSGMPDPVGGDQEWIGQKYPKADIIQDLFPNQIKSYKAHAKDGIPKGARIVCFHGIPRPHQVQGWVKHVWKIDGGTCAEFEIVGNTSGPQLVANIKHAISLELPKLKVIAAHKAHAIIVGGAPSLKEELEDIRARVKHGQFIFATNNTYAYLKENDIDADYHIMLDARPEMAAFVPKNADCLYASQCDPSVFKKNKKNKISLWHHNATDIFDIIGCNSGDAIIAGGQSVGLKTIALAHFLGFRRFHIYGMDSSYRDDEHHAYAQPLNDNENVIDVTCGDAHFKCAPWMVVQAEQFKELVTELTKGECVITVHGSGLIPHIASVIANEGTINYNHTENLLNRKEAHA